MPKRVFDVAVAIISLPLVLPATAVMAVALAVDLRGWPFFVQARVGRDGRPFRMYKLRTMHHPRPGEEKVRVVTDWSTFVFSPPDAPDPRLTRLGSFARRTSLDELPNLVNVFRGEMSLVGPRPELPELVCQYPDEYHRRHTVRPGIAGLAQVEGRSDLAYDQIMKYDLAYVDEHSLREDLRILVKSVAVVLKGSGAR